VTDVASFDPFDPAQQPTHHATMAALRATCPVTQLASGVTVVARYADVRSALTDPGLRNSHAARSPGVSVPAHDRLFFFEYDPPEHSQLRHLVVDLFSRQRADAMSPTIAALAAELLRPLVAAGGGELVSSFSVPFAGRLMMRLAGFPEDDAPRWRAWIKDMVVSGFSFTNRNERGVGFAECYPEVLAYLDDRLADGPTSANRRTTCSRASYTRRPTVIRSRPTTAA
jgi:cytochrome P450